MARSATGCWQRRYSGKSRRTRYSFQKMSDRSTLQLSTKVLFPAPTGEFLPLMILYSFQRPASLSADQPTSCCRSWLFLQDEPSLLLRRSTTKNCCRSWLRRFRLEVRFFPSFLLLMSIRFFPPVLIYMSVRYSLRWSCSDSLGVNASVFTTGVSSLRCAHRYIPLRNRQSACAGSDNRNITTVNK